LLGALQGTLSSPLQVTLAEAAAPAEPLPGSALTQVHGKYYSVSSDSEVITRNPATFILGLPVPDGVPTDNLAIALLSFNPDAGENVWAPLLSIYDEAAKLLLAPLPYISTEEQIVIIIEHPGFQSPPNPPEPPVVARFGGIAASQLVPPEFFTICWMDTEQAQLYCIEWEALIIQETLQGGFFGASPEGFYSEFQGMGYPEPHLG
jgi:hypothetical protein